MMNTFRIAVADQDLEQLKSRLRNTIWPGEIDNAHWKRGTSRDYLQELCAYWADGFDWRHQESRLNEFDHYTTRIDEQDLHFIYQKGSGDYRVPILLVHGWPDSFYRFYKLIPALTKADSSGRSFDVIVPSIPGYGFSGIPQKKGMDSRHIAGLFNKLMTETLGFPGYFAHGGDWGGSIVEKLGLYHAKHVSGIHLTDLPFAHTLDEPEDAGEKEKKFFEKTRKWQQTEGAYTMIQSTKPQSLAYGLSDSPAGLAGWITEKFYAWSDHPGDLEAVFTKDELLTNLSIYWFTGTIHSANTLYYEEIQAVMSAKYNPLVKLNPFDKTGARIEVSSAFAMFPKDIASAPRELVNRFFRISKWTDMPAGGHFAALEKPDLLVNDIRDFVRDVSLAD